MNSLISYLTLAVITLFQPIFPKGHHRFLSQGPSSFHPPKMGEPSPNTPGTRG